MILESDFKDNGDLPARFTCDGGGIPPHLLWKDFPKETKSFALVVSDPDAPSGTFIHWIVFDIPKNINELRGILPSGAKELENSAGRKGYFPPCPPSGTHRYIFTIYSLDAESIRADGTNFFEKLEEHFLSKATLTGLYKGR